MEPKIVRREEFAVLGVLARVTLESADFEDIWLNQFMFRHDEVKPHSTHGAYYGVCFCVGDGVIDYIAGMAVGNVPTVPAGLAMREVPTATDAVFQCTVASISPTYRSIHGEWLPNSEYEYDRSAPDFEYYPPGTETGESPVFIHIPVRVKTPQ